MPDVTITPVGETERLEAQENAVKKLQNGVGRPTNIDEECVKKLTGAFQKGLNVQSACIYAGITRQTFYERCKKDGEFLDTMQRAKNNLVEVAGEAVDDILRDKEHRDRGKMARWVFEKKLPDEYGQKAIPPAGPTQNNYFLLNKNELSNLASKPDIANSDPTELLKALEEAPDVDDGAEEESASPLH